MVWAAQFVFTTTADSPAFGGGQREKRRASDGSAVLFASPVPVDVGGAGLACEGWPTSSE
jgi:hypothetical protein